MPKYLKYVLLGLTVVAMAVILFKCTNDNSNDFSSVNSSNPDVFGAPQLSGTNEVPPTNSQTTGSVMFRVNRDGNRIARSIDFVAQVKGGVTLRQAHFHCAPTGVNGPVVAFMAGRHDGGVNVNTGVWARGNLTDGSISSTGTGLTNPVTCATANPAVAGAIISTIDDFVQQAIAGNIYVCYHDATFPNGAIRAQVTLRDKSEKFKDKDDRDTQDDT